MTLCPSCRHDWPKDSEHSIAVEVAGECLWCKFKHLGLTDPETDKSIHDEYERRRHLIVWAPVLNPLPRY